MNSQAFFSVMSFVLAGFGTGCVAADLDGGGDEGAVDSTQQALVADRVRLTFNVGSIGKPSNGQLVVHLVRNDGTWREHTFGAGQSWPANSTQSASLIESTPGLVRNIQIWYQNGSSWRLRGIHVDDMAGSTVLTPRFFLPMDRSISAQLGPIFLLKLPDVLTHAPSTNLNNKHEDFYVSYRTWNGGHYCAQVRDNQFFHAPRLSTGCDWANGHHESYMDYLHWNGTDRWRATVNTSTKLFTHQRHPSGPPAHSSANLQYDNVNGTDWEMRIK